MKLAENTNTANSIPYLTPEGVLEIVQAQLPGAFVVRMGQWHDDYTPKHTVVVPYYIELSNGKATFVEWKGGWVLQELLAHSPDVYRSDLWPEIPLPGTTAPAATYKAEHRSRRDLMADGWISFLDETPAVGSRILLMDIWRQDTDPHPLQVAETVDNGVGLYIIDEQYHHRWTSLDNVMTRDYLWRPLVEENTPTATYKAGGAPDWTHLQPGDVVVFRMAEGGQPTEYPVYDVAVITGPPSITPAYARVPGIAVSVDRSSAPRTLGEVSPDTDFDLVLGEVLQATSWAEVVAACGGAAAVQHGYVSQFRSLDFLYVHHLRKGWAMPSPEATYKAETGWEVGDPVRVARVNLMPEQVETVTEEGVRWLIGQTGRVVAVSGSFRVVTLDNPIPGNLLDDINHILGDRMHPRWLYFLPGELEPYDPNVGEATYKAEGERYPIGSIIQARLGSTDCHYGLYLVVDNHSYDMSNLYDVVYIGGSPKRFTDWRQRPTLGENVLHHDHLIAARSLESLGAVGRVFPLTFSSYSHPDPVVMRDGWGTDAPEAATYKAAEHALTSEEALQRMGPVVRAWRYYLRDGILHWIGERADGSLVGLTLDGDLDGETDPTSPSRRAATKSLVEYCRRDAEGKNFGERWIEIPVPTTPETVTYKAKVNVQPGDVFVVSPSPTSPTRWVGICFGLNSEGKPRGWYTQGDYSDAIPETMEDLTSADGWDREVLQASSAEIEAVIHRHIPAVTWEKDRETYVIPDHHCLIRILRHGWPESQGAVATYKAEEAFAARSRVQIREMPSATGPFWIWAQGRTGTVVEGHTWSVAVRLDDPLPEALMGEVMGLRWSEDPDCLLLLNEEVIPLPGTVPEEAAYKAAVDPSEIQKGDVVVIRNAIPHDHYQAVLCFGHGKTGNPLCYFFAECADNLADLTPDLFTQDETDKAVFEATSEAEVQEACEAVSIATDPWEEERERFQGLRRGENDIVGFLRRGWTGTEPLDAATYKAEAETFQKGDRVRVIAYPKAALQAWSLGKTGTVMNPSYLDTICITVRLDEPLPENLRESVNRTNLDEDGRLTTLFFGKELEHLSDEPTAAYKAQIGQQGTLGWTPREGETVLVNSIAIPDLLGEKATILDVLDDGRILIKVKKNNAIYMTRPRGVVPDRPAPVTPPATPALPRRMPVGSANEVIQSALTLKRNVAFDYVDLEGRYTRREVEPHYVFQARGTGNELLLCRDYKMRHGEWRTFRVEAMTNEHLGQLFVFTPEVVLPDVRHAVLMRMDHLKEKYPDPAVRALRAEKDHLLQGLRGYKGHLLSMVEASSEHRASAVMEPSFAPRIVTRPITTIKGASQFRAPDFSSQPGWVDMCTELPPPRELVEVWSESIFMGGLGIYLPERARVYVIADAERARRAVATGDDADIYDSVRGVANFTIAVPVRDEPCRRYWRSLSQDAASATYKASMDDRNMKLAQPNVVTVEDILQWREAVPRVTDVDEDGWVKAMTLGRYHITGSFARGDAREDSDVDLLTVLSPEENTHYNDSGGGYRNLPLDVIQLADAFRAYKAEHGVKLGDILVVAQLDGEPSLLQLQEGNAVRISPWEDAQGRAHVHLTMGYPKHHTFDRPDYILRQEDGVYVVYEVDGTEEGVLHVVREVNRFETNADALDCIHTLRSAMAGDTPYYYDPEGWDPSAPARFGHGYAQRMKLAAVDGAEPSPDDPRFRTFETMPEEGVPFWLRIPPAHMSVGGVCFGILWDGRVYTHWAKGLLPTRGEAVPEKGLVRTTRFAWMPLDAEPVPETAEAAYKAQATPSPERSDWVPFAERQPEVGQLIWYRTIHGDIWVARWRSSEVDGGWMMVYDTLDDAMADRDGTYYDDMNTDKKRRWLSMGVTDAPAESTYKAGTLRSMDELMRRFEILKVWWEPRAVHAGTLPRRVEEGTDA